MTQSIQILAVRPHVFRYPLDVPVQTSFGTMTDRPMVLVDVEDTDGVHGLGEVWCNFPAVGAEHRARLIDNVFAPILTQQEFSTPLDAFAQMTAATEILALQSGEPGPFAQVIAGLDAALWDLCARKAEQPLWRYLGGTNPVIDVYASGLNPTSPEILAAEKQSEGHTRFKLKIGFGLERDLHNLRTLRATLGGDAQLMADANQAWSLTEAQSHCAELTQFNLDWIEEPLRADRPWSEWNALKHVAPIPLAAGENIANGLAFERALQSGVLHIVQPDLAKWGGISQCFALGKRIIASGACYCPHYLGGGVGLLASAHVLAAVGGDGALEIDANPNPLRTDLCGPLNKISDGSAKLSEEPGLGVVPDLQTVERYAVSY